MKCYDEKNRKCIRTRKLLMRTFLELLEEKGIGNIKVTEITERAMINRTTFYDYYDNIEDIALDCGIKT